jgi:hypothetical protein
MENISPADLKRFHCSLILRETIRCSGLLRLPTFPDEITIALTYLLESWTLLLRSRPTRAIHSSPTMRSPVSAIFDRPAKIALSRSWPLVVCLPLNRPFRKPGNQRPQEEMPGEYEGCHLLFRPRRSSYAPVCGMRTGALSK